ncbi:MAG: XisI protein [Moorea sp. SIO1F2]|uniref:XisI protein n=4 Tax=Moorena TaxID=1155738 RepID=A0A1D8TPT4_9CYAN|nr:MULTISPECIES: XisI protein [Moorena]NEO63263.1 XisI protein [Moorena sp. SIO4G2]NEO88745.1 XisI protein [Moorena sp. SIO3G5]NEP47960.1 XisI protein [Moorena sp. SIO3C2]NEQ81861.1 XisI protein [Moorena sp. SIO2I5]NES82425.1 XisI protein [Moorena sp. SIO2B7]
MDTLNKTNLKQAIIKVLQDYVEFLGNDPESDLQLIIDENKDHYLLMEIGWHKNQRIYGSLIHIDIINEKIWLQQDGTEEGVANELVKLGISPQQIVLAFKTLERRKITDFAVS